MKAKRFWILGLVAFAAAAYLLVPGCGNKGNNSANNAPYIPVCQPGQYCGNFNTAGGVPLINAPSFSALDPMQGGSSLTLSFAAPNVVAGQAYTGPVNISGTLHIANGACPGGPGGDFPVQGQGTWNSGYAGQIALVSGQLTVNAGIAGGSVYIYPALVKDSAAGTSGYPSPYPYIMTDGYGVAVTFCQRTFAFYN